MHKQVNECCFEASNERKFVDIIFFQIKMLICINYIKKGLPDFAG